MRIERAPLPRQTKRGAFHMRENHLKNPQIHLVQ
jgi:hypothetical protein